MDGSCWAEISQVFEPRRVLWSTDELWSQSSEEVSTTQLRVVHLPVAGVFDCRWIASHALNLQRASLDRTYHLLSRISTTLVCLRLLIETSLETATKAAIWVVRFVARRIEHRRFRYRASDDGDEPTAETMEQPLVEGDLHACLRLAARQPI